MSDEKEQEKKPEGGGGLESLVDQAHAREAAERAEAEKAAAEAEKAKPKKKASLKLPNVKLPKVPKASLFAAMLLGMGLLGGMVGLWQLYGDGSEELPQSARFLGQMHPLLVHLPVALLGVVFLMELLSLIPPFRELERNTLFLLWVASLGAGGAILAGYFLKAGGEYVGARVDTHMWLGLVVAVGAWASLILKSAGAAGFVYRVMLGLTVVVLVLAGHLGGTITHGPNYLVKEMPEPYRSWSIFDDSRFLVFFGEVTGGDEPVLTGRLYDDYVAAILAEKCASCHGPDKQKGKLRLDTHEAILAGAHGSDYPNVVPGRPLESELLVRVELPLSDDDHMPPENEAQLTSAEIALLEWWIAKGASAELGIADVDRDPELTAILQELGPPRVPVVAKNAVEEEGPKEGEAAAVPKVTENERIAALKEIEAKGFALRRVSVTDEGLQFNAVNVASEFDDSALASFEPVADSIVELRLGKTQISDESGPLLGKMRSLKTLHLENTAITDAAVKEMVNLDELEYLNLYGTGVTDAVIEHVLELDNLKTIYLWQTKVTQKGAAKLRAAREGIYVDMGWTGEPGASGKSGKKK